MEVNDESENLEHNVYWLKFPEQYNGVINYVQVELITPPSSLISTESPIFLQKLQDGQTSDKVIANAIRQLESNGKVIDGQLKRFGLPEP